MDHNTITDRTIEFLREHEGLIFIDVDFANGSGGSFPVKVDRTTAVNYALIVNDATDGECVVIPDVSGDGRNCWIKQRQWVTVAQDIADGERVGQVA